MNLRDIKKDIEYVIGAFVDDCALFLSVHPGKNADEVSRRPTPSTTSSARP